jgi:TRAP-type C4-dicarboxylate transport system substrate-binding protein
MSVNQTLTLGVPIISLTMMSDETWDRLTEKFAIKRAMKEMAKTITKDEVIDLAFAAVENCDQDEIDQVKELLAELPKGFVPEEEIAYIDKCIQEKQDFLDDFKLYETIQQEILESCGGDEYVAEELAWLYIFN